MNAMWDAFHFLRPLWLLAILPMLAIWLAARIRQSAPQSATLGIAPHLAAALATGDAKRRRLQPIDLILALSVLLAVAAAGPTWSKRPNPLIANTAPLVIALKVTPSMDATDLAPTRLERAKFKILDLITARAGARTALVAYAGSAHNVAPLTEDPNILQPLVQSLTPATMPVEGDDAAAAYTVAREILSTAEMPGAVLFVLDDINPSAIGAIGTADDGPAPPLLFLVAAPADTSLPQLEQIPEATTIRLTPNNSDIDRIARQLRSAQASALAADDRLEWNDRGGWLAWPAALLCLLWFRRGWTMRWALAVMAFGLAQSPSQASAEGWIDWFLTADQQGQIAFNRKDFSKAGTLFQDPIWSGYAKYRAGEYEDAISILSEIETPEAAMTQGLAQIKNRQYRPAVRSFETALERRPDYPEAAHNLEIAKAIVDYVETTREQSDTGEDSGIGADDVVFDNEDARGATTQIDAQDEGALPLNADQWIQSIDTNMSDFLRSRFLLENAGADG